VSQHSCAAPQPPRLNLAGQALADEFGISNVHFVPVPNVGVLEYGTARLSHTPTPCACTLRTDDRCIVCAAGMARPRTCTMPTFELTVVCMSRVVPQLSTVLEPWMAGTSSPHYSTRPSSCVSTLRELREHTQTHPAAHRPLPTAYSPPIATARAATSPSPSSPPRAAPAPSPPSRSPSPPSAVVVLLLCM
jgi:hypothetical protein